MKLQDACDSLAFLQRADVSCEPDYEYGRIVARPGHRAPENPSEIIPTEHEGFPVEIVWPGLDPFARYGR